MSDLINFYVPISKVEAQADGSRIISGYASTPTKDLDGEIVSLDAIKSALPAYWEWRNIRQMHQPLAVGRAQEASIDEKGLFLTSKIVDPACIKLIDEKVLQGYSIGGRKLAKKGDTITELELIEISVVDRPANPECPFQIIGKSARAGIELVKVAGGDDDLVIPSEQVGPLRKFFSALFGGDVAKRQFSDKERQDAADAGEALPDGSYPIKTKQDLKNAIQAFGRAKNKAKVKAHIKARARALDATDMIPEAWSKFRTGKDLAKGLYDVGRLANLVEELQWLHSGQVFEEALEEDGSEVPAKIGAAIETLCEILTAMVKEETKELITAIDGKTEIVEEAAMPAPHREAWLKMVGKWRMSTALTAPLVRALDSMTGIRPEEPAIADEDSALSNLRKELQMADTTLEKRFGAANKAAMMKAKMHLGKAVACHGAAMKCLGKAASACSAMKAANKAVAIADIMKSDGVAGHLAEAAGHMESMADHHELAMSAMGKAASGFAGEGGGAGLMDEDDVGGQSGSVSQAELTEGGVAEYTADEPYPGKGARGGFSKAVVEKMIADAVKVATTEQENTMLKATVEALRAQPGPNKSRAFAFDASGTPFFGKGNGAGASDPVSLLLEGVDMNVQSEDAAIAASRKMLTNMFSAPQTFGKSVMSAEFKGRPVRQAN